MNEDEGSKPKKNGLGNQGLCTIGRWLEEYNWRDNSKATNHLCEGASPLASRDLANISLLQLNMA